MRRRNSARGSVAAWFWMLASPLHLELCRSAPLLVPAERVRRAAARKWSFCVRSACRNPHYPVPHFLVDGMRDRKILWLIGSCACAHHLCQFPRIDRTGLRPDPQFTFHLAALAPGQLRHPKPLAIAVFLFDLHGPRLVGQMRAKSLTTTSARLVHRDIQRARFARENGLDLLDYVVRLERLAVIFQNQLVHAEAGLGAKVARELPRVVALDTDHPFARGQNLADFFRVERVEVFDLQMIGAHALLGRSEERRVG